MNEETRQMLERLADKLGTTVDHLWSVLVHQAPITASSDIAVFFASILLLYFVAKKIVKSTNDESGFLHHKEDLAVLAWIGWFIASALVGVMLFFNFEFIISGFLNPEYWALRQLIH